MLSSPFAVVVPVWSDFKHVVSLLCFCSQHIMKMMTRLLGQYVYGIHLSQHSSKQGATRRSRLSSKQRSTSSVVPLEGVGDLTAKSAGLHPSRHKRDASISTNLENFTGDPIPKPVGIMPVVEEANESKDDSRIRSQSHTPTTASLRTARELAKESARRHRSETEAGKGDAPRLLGQNVPSVDMTSPLRETEPPSFAVESAVEEEAEDDLESAESSTSMQEYSIHDSRQDSLEGENSSDDGGMDEHDTPLSVKKRLISGSQTDTSTASMTEALLAEPDDKSLASSAHAESVASGDNVPGGSGAATPLQQDSDHDDDLQPSKIYALFKAHGCLYDIYTYVMYVKGLKSRCVSLFLAVSVAADMKRLL